MDLSSICDTEVMDYEPREFFRPNPCRDISIPNSQQNGGAVTERHITVGAFLRTQQTRTVYAVSPGHCVAEGNSYYFLNTDKTSDLLGTCEHIFMRYEEPMSYDLALIKVDSEFNVMKAVHDSSIECDNSDKKSLNPMRYTMLRITTKDMNRKKVEVLAHGAPDLKHNLAVKHQVYTDKNIGIYRAITIERKQERGPTIEDCMMGSMVTSRDPDTDAKVKLGMLIGQLGSSNTDKKEKLYVVFPLIEAIDELNKMDLFKENKLELVTIELF